MDATSNYLSRELMKAINEAREGRLKVLAAGSLGDFAAYKFQAGYLSGLHDVEEWLKKIDLADDERGSPFARAS